MRSQSKVAPGWWDYTTLDREILDDAARLTEKDILQLSRPGFKVTFYETLQEFYAAEALEFFDVSIRHGNVAPCAVLLAWVGGVVPQPLGYRCPFFGALAEFFTKIAWVFGVLEVS